jgi:hypothetical protein
MKARKPRNPIARALRSPRFGKRTVRSGKTYRRKERTRPREDQRG